MVLLQHTQDYNIAVSITDVKSFKVRHDTKHNDSQHNDNWYSNKQMSQCARTTLSIEKHYVVCCA